MKAVASSLRDVGHPVTESHLVLTLVRGLKPYFSNMVNDIANMVPLSTFARARAKLDLKERRLLNKASFAATMTLIATSSSACSSANCRTSPSPLTASTPTPPSSGNRANNYGSGGGGGTGGGGNRRIAAGNHRMVAATSATAPSCPTPITLLALGCSGKVSAQR